MKTTIIERKTYVFPMNLLHPSRHNRILVSHKSIVSHPEGHANTMLKKIIPTSKFYQLFRIYSFYNYKFE